jgi:hypothetical protein
MSYAFSEVVHQDFGSLFEPDTVVTEQFYASLRKRQHCDPERRLMAAVLEDVVACLSIDPSLSGKRQRRDFDDAECWINAPDNSDWLFSFNSVCEALEIDAGYLRKGLNQWVIKYRDRERLAPQSRNDRAAVRHKTIAPKSFVSPLNR